MLDEVETDVETVGMDLSNICDLEDRFEADALLPNVANLVLLCGIAHITKVSSAFCTSSSTKWTSLEYRS